MSSVRNEGKVLNSRITKRNQLDRFEQVKIKGFNILFLRSFDILFSTASILLFAIPMVVIAILIKLYSPDGPIIFKQRRLGLNGKEFEVFKFRTMVVGAEEKLKKLLEEDEVIREEYLTFRKLKNDIRIIPKVGSFLRKASLDELPQFFNVLLGSMSIVGPRPYIGNEFMKKDKAKADIITSVKPGVTGLWQVTDRHKDTFYSRVNKDIEYVKNKNFIEDIIIIIKTVRVMLVRDGI